MVRRSQPSILVSCVLLACVALLAACAGLPPRNPPRVDVVGVQLDRLEGADAYFAVTREPDEHGDNDIVMQALQGRLSIEGEEVARASLTSPPVRIPARGSTRADLTSQTGMDQLLRAVAAAMRRGATLVAPGARPTLRYSIEGSATLEGGYRLPFSRSGEIGETRQ